MGSFCRRFYPLSTQSSVWVLACSSSPSTLAPCSRSPQLTLYALRLPYIISEKAELYSKLYVPSGAPEAAGGRSAAPRALTCRCKAIAFNSRICARLTVCTLIYYQEQVQGKPSLTSIQALQLPRSRVELTQRQCLFKSYVTCCRTLNLAYVTKLSVNFERATAQAVFWVSGFSAPLETQQPFYCYDHGRGISHKMTAPFLILPPFSAPILHGRRLTPS